MKKIIRLTESDLARIVKRVIQEGNIDKSSKEKDLDVKMENFRDKIRDFLKSKDCKVKQVGTDFEVHCDGEHVGQVMFRRNAITVKKEGSRFGKDFKFNEMGDIKAELSKLIRLTESDLTRIVKRVIKESEMGDDNFWDNIRGFDFGNPKDFTDLLRNITYLISDSEDANDFEMKFNQFTEDNQEDIDNLTDDDKNRLDSFINNVMTRYDFNS